MFRVLSSNLSKRMDSMSLFKMAKPLGKVSPMYGTLTVFLLAYFSDPDAFTKVHVHVLPRKGGDFERNDDVYDHLEEFSAVPRYGFTIFS